MAIIIETKPVVSAGQRVQLAKNMQAILAIVPAGADVAIEGTPVYLHKPWENEHTLGYNCLVPVGMELLSPRARKVEHVVLLDDYSGEGASDPTEYLSKIEPRIDRVVMESAFVPRAVQLMAKLAGRELRREDGRVIALSTPSGRLSCPLLDAAFQGTKEVGYSVIIHPIEFSHEQEEMRQILKAEGGGILPCAFINIFIKGGSINKAYLTSRDGRTTRVGF